MKNWHTRHIAPPLLPQAAATRKGQTWLGMNWDWTPNLFPWSSLLQLAIRGKPNIATYHYPGLAVCTGVNSEGLGFVWTSSGLLPKVSPIAGIPTYVLIFELMHCSTVLQAIKQLKKLRRAGSFNFFLGDETGQIAVIEATPKQLYIDQSADAIGRANHYRDEKIKRKSKQKIPQTPQGRCTTYRDCRMQELLNEYHGKIHLTAAKKILSDREGDGHWVFQYPHGNKSIYRNSMSIDSIIVDCQQAALYTRRGGLELGQWQKLSTL